jgi:PIN domain nuclease of toxin-antitoxin system
VKGVVLDASAVLAFGYAEDGAEDVEPLLEAATISTDPLTSTRGLSLGDRACLAVAKRLDAIAVTADRAWPELNHGVEVRLIRAPKEQR